MNTGGCPLLWSRCTGVAEPPAASGLQEARQAVDEDRCCATATGSATQRFAKAAESCSATNWPTSRGSARCTRWAGFAWDARYLRDRRAVLLPAPDRLRLRLRAGRSIRTWSDFADLDRGQDRSARRTAIYGSARCDSPPSGCCLILPAAGSPGPAYDLDLDRGVVEILRLDGGGIGGLLARRAHLLRDHPAAAEFTGRAMLDLGAVFRGRVQLTSKLPLPPRLPRIGPAAGRGRPERRRVRGLRRPALWSTAETVLLDGAVALPGVRSSSAPGSSTC